MQDRRRVIGAGELSSVMTDGSNTEALDVLFSSNDGSQVVAIRGEENWPDNGWTPIGIVVVPGIHNRYEDNTCGVMALKSLQVYINDNAMHYNKGKFYFWSDYAYKYSSYDTYTYVYLPTQLTSTSENVGFLLSSGQSLVWPYQVSDGVLGDAVETNSNSFGHIGNSGSFVNAKVNAFYGGGDAVFDMNGLRNTLYSYWYVRKDGLSWNTSGNDNCDVQATRYYTVGTVPALMFASEIEQLSETEIQDVGTADSPIINTGYWYVPALGELAYILPKRYEIKKVMNALSNKYGVTSDYNINYNITSSSRKDNDTHYIISTPYGSTSSQIMSGGMQIHDCFAFMRF